LFKKSDLSDPSQTKRYYLDGDQVITVIPEGVHIIPKPDAQTNRALDRLMHKEVVHFKGMAAVVQENENTVPVFMGIPKVFIEKGCEDTKYWWQCRYCWYLTQESIQNLLGHNSKECPHCLSWVRRSIDSAWAKTINQRLFNRTHDLDAQWTWFVTWTFRDPAPWAIRKGWTRIGQKYAWNAWGAFIFWMQHHLNLKYGAVYDWTYFVVMEAQQRGTPHFHALYYFPGLEDDAELLLKARKYLWTRGGYNKILPFRKELGAEFYLANYMSKEMIDWEDDSQRQPTVPVPPMWIEPGEAKQLAMFKGRGGDGIHGFVDGP